MPVVVILSISLPKGLVLHDFNVSFGAQTSSSVFFFWFFFVGVVVVFTLFTKSLWVGDIFLPTLSRAAILSFAWI